MEDLIKRSDAIKALHEEWDGGWLEATGEWVADNCEAVLNRLPSADRPQEWIPCDKELPALMTGVLGTDEYGYIRHVYRAIRHGKSRFETVEEGMGINILAWLPLPKPWKGVGDDSKSLNCNSAD